MGRRRRRRRRERERAVVLPRYLKKISTQQGEDPKTSFKRTDHSPSHAQQRPYRRPYYQARKQQVTLLLLKVRQVQRRRRSLPRSGTGVCVCNTILVFFF